MNIFTTILFWVGIICLADGSLGILFQEKWQKLVGKLDIQRLALIEIGVGLIFLVVHYLLERGM